MTAPLPAPDPAPSAGATLPVAFRPPRNAPTEFRPRRKRYRFKDHPTGDAEGLRPCTGCATRIPHEAFGVRKDGRPNTQCPPCRHGLASHGGKMSRPSARALARDERALRVIERACGIPHRLWHRPAARAWEAAHGVTLQTLWSARMKTLYARDRRRAGKSDALPSAPALPPRRPEYPVW